MPDSLLRFGDFVLDGRSGELRQGGERVKLAQQPFAVLWLLASRSGEVLTREEIREHIWGADTHVDFERGLNFCILQIRRALGDDAKAPRWIETLPRRGYRLIAQVERCEASAETSKEADRDTPSQSEEFSIRPQLTWRPWIAAPLVLIILLIAFYFVWTEGRARPTDQRIMLAVLPFDNLSGDADQDFFSAGMTEETIAQLGGLDPEHLGIIARTTMEGYKDTAQNIGEIGDELGVDYVLEGGVRREEGEIRITVQLISVRDQAQLWSQSYQRNRWSALLVQRDIGRSIARALRLKLFPGPSSLPDRAGSHEPDAHDAYLAGRFSQRKHTKEALLESLRLFERASELDPRLALPLTALSESYHHLVMMGEMKPDVGYPRAKDAAFRALELAPFLAEAHLAAGRVAFHYDWAWDEAREHLLMAREINPSLAEARLELGWLQIAHGKSQEGLREVAHAVALDSGSLSVNLGAGRAMIYARNYAAAHAQCQRILEIEPAFEAAEDCLRWVKRLTRSKAASPMIEQQSGDDLVSDMSHRHDLLARILALRGENEMALDHLEDALAERQPSMALVAIDPAFDALHGHLRFQTIVERVGWDLAALLAPLSRLQDRSMSPKIELSTAPIE